MKSTQKLAELTDLTPVKNPEEVKGGFFFFLNLFGGHNKGYEAPKHGYEAPKKNEYGGGKSGKSGKKGY